MSLPPESVTVDHEPPKAAQVSFESVTSSRSTMPVVESTPDSVSVPLLSVTGIESDV